MNKSQIKLSALATCMGLILTACGGGGGGGSSASPSPSPAPTPTPTPATAAAKGLVADGYYAGSTVTLDINDDGICESTEPTTTTDANGGYDFSKVPGASGQHQVCVTGGVDKSTGQSLSGQLVAPLGGGVVTPLTTLVVAQAKASGQSTAAAASSLAQNLGLGSLPLLSADPVAAASSNPSLLQTTAAIQALIVQTTSILQAAGGGSGATSASTTSALFNSVAATVSAQIASLTTPLSPSTLGNASFITNLVSAATANAQSNPALTSSLPSLTSLSPTSVAAFVQPSLSAVTNSVATANPSSLLSSTNNPAGNAQSNPVAANTVGALASTLLTTAAANSGVTPAQLAAISSVAINVSSGGTPTAASPQSTLAAISNNVPASVSSNLPASVTTALSNAGSPSNTVQVSGIAINCVPNCTSGASNLLTNSPIYANLTSTGALNDVTITLGTPNGSAVNNALVAPSGLTAAVTSALTSPIAASFPVTAGSEYQGSLRINVVPTAGGNQNLTLTISNVVLYQSLPTAGGSTVVTGFIPSTATLTASGVTSSGVTGNATLNAQAISSFITFNPASSSFTLNVGTLLNTLGQASSVLKQAAGLDGTTKASYNVTTAFNMLAIQNNSYATGTNTFAVQVNFK